jgi:FecR protein
MSLIVVKQRENKPFRVENKDPKFRRFYVDWWKIQRSTIYGLVIACVVIGLLGYGGWWFWKNRDSIQTQEVPKNAAIISSFEGDVRIIRASTREVIRVTKTIYVAAGDTIQTQADGKTQLQMIDGSTLTIKPNSTVIVRDNTSIFGGSTNVKVSLGGGQINVKTEDQSGESQNIVEVKQVENKVSGQTEANFGINQKTDSGEIRISRGSVETSVNGERIVIKDNEYASIAPNGKVMPKEKSLDSPKLIAPPTLEQVFVSDAGSTDITLRWQKTDNVPTAYYRVEVATSPFFVADSMTIEKEPLVTPNLTLSKITAGNYFWRVRSVATSGQISDWSEPWKFTVATREVGGTISLSDLKSENIGGNIYVISGKTVPGTVIRVVGRETFAVGDGSFRIQVTVPSGEVSIEANDEHGGRTKYSLNVNTGKAARTN